MVFKQIRRITVVMINDETDKGFAVGGISSVGISAIDSKPDAKYMIGACGAGRQSILIQPFSPPSISDTVDLSDKLHDYTVIISTAMQQASVVFDRAKEIFKNMCDVLSMQIPDTNNYRKRHHIPKMRRIKGESKQNRHFYRYMKIMKNAQQRMRQHD